jgi:hypothetical protein
MEAFHCRIRDLLSFFSAIFSVTTVSAEDSSFKKMSEVVLSCSQKIYVEFERDLSAVLEEK